VTEPPPPYQCKDPNYIGVHCNVPNDNCEIYKPCSPYGFCRPNNTLQSVYTCQCPDGYSGHNCESDDRVCKSSTCW
jgi:hypothetical protein